jgi:hypothetical protein
MSSYYPPKIVARPASSAAGADLHCRKCHQSLAGLKSDEKCPKCGLSIAVSLQGADIRYSDPAWVNRLRLGAVFVFWGTLIGLFGIALTGANYFDPVMDVHIPPAVIAAACLLYALGNWFLTAPDPSGLGEKNYGQSRKISRLAWFFSALGGATLIGGAFAHPSVTLHWEYLLALDLCYMTGLTGTVTLLDYLSKLAVRMRDTRISERARTLCKGFVVVGSALIVTSFVHDFLLHTQWAIENDLAGLILCFQAVAALSGLALFFAWILLLSKLGARLKELTKLARATWGA